MGAVDLGGFSDQKGAGCLFQSQFTNQLFRVRGVYFPQRSSALSGYGDARPIR